jgi:hypothetical protein
MKPAKTKARKLSKRLPCLYCGTAFKKCPLALFGRGRPKHRPCCEQCKGKPSHGNFPPIPMPILYGLLPYAALTVASVMGQIAFETWYLRSALRSMLAFWDRREDSGWTAADIRELEEIRKLVNP